MLPLVVRIHDPGGAVRGIAWPPGAQPHMWRSTEIDLDRRLGMKYTDKYRAMEFYHLCDGDIVHSEVRISGPFAWMVNLLSRFKLYQISVSGYVTYSRED